MVATKLINVQIVKEDIVHPPIVAVDEDDSDDNDDDDDDEDEEKDVSR